MVSRVGSRSEGTDRTPRVVLGQIAGAHGLRGQVRVAVLGDAPANLLAAPWVELSFAPRDPLRDTDARRYDVVFAGPGRTGELRLALAGVADRDAAAELCGAYVLGDAALLPPLAAGEHYWYELVGCRVEAEGGRALGTLREIWETGAHDVLVIEDGAGRRHLVPAAEPFLLRVEPAARLIVIAPVPGLLAGDASVE